MAQNNRVQDGTVVYSTNDPTAYDLGFNVQGNVNVTKALVVAQANLSDSIISSSTGSDLQLTVQPGAAANVRIYPPADGGNVLINNVAWITNTPNLGGFIGASSANVLRYYPFVAANVVSDTLTVSALNAAYPNIVPGQMVVGSTVVYLNVGLSTWRILSGSTATTQAPGYQEFSATSGQTIFNTTLSTVAKSSGKAYLSVFVNGVFQQEGASKAYLVTGATQITFNDPVTLASDVVIYAYN